MIAALSVCMCVAHIKCINSNFNFNYEYFSSSMSGRGGRGGSINVICIQLRALRWLPNQPVLVASCSLQHCSLAASGNGSSSCK